MTEPPSHSYGGQLIALLTSEVPHVIVEGLTDKAALERLLARYQVDPENLVVVVADRFKGTADTAGLGNGELVKHIVLSVLRRKPKKSAQVFGFVDREFEAFDIATLADLLPTHVRRDQIFLTRGHSIENYFFNPNVMANVVSELIPDRDSNSIMLQTLRAGWSDLCRGAAVLSEMCRQVPLPFDEVCRAIGDTCFEGANRSFSSGSVLAVVARRRSWLGEQASRPQRILKNIEQDLLSSDDIFCTWFSHGHISLRMLYAWTKSWRDDTRIDTISRKYLNRMSKEQFENTLVRQWSLEHDRIVDGYPQHLLSATGVIAER